MFRTIILPIFRSARLCYSVWYNAPTVLLAGSIVGVLYHKLLIQSSAPEDGRNYRPKHVELIGIINKPLFLHLVGCLYYFIILLSLSLITQCDVLYKQNVGVNVYFLGLGYGIEHGGFVPGKGKKMSVPKMFKMSLEPN